MKVVLRKQDWVNFTGEFLLKTKKEPMSWTNFRVV